MIRHSGTIVYVDGRREPFETGIRGSRAWERYATRHGYPLNPTSDGLGSFPVTSWQLVIAHAALGVAGGFDAWADTVDGIEDWVAAPVPPTPPAASPE